MAQQHSENIILLIHGLSGSISGTLTTFCLYPLENLKTRLQVLEKQAEKEEEKLEEDQANAIKKVSKKEIGLFELIKKVFQEEGFKGFYKGVQPLCLGSFISYGVYFYFYEFFKKFLHKHFHLNQNSWKGYAVTSGLAGCITTVATNPFWIINTKMTVDKVF